MADKAVPVNRASAFQLGNIAHHSGMAAMHNGAGQRYGAQSMHPSARGRSAEFSSAANAHRAAESEHRSAAKSDTYRSVPAGSMHYKVRSTGDKARMN